MPSTVAMVMAGGKGSRLGPLSCHRAKPSVPFGGRYRIIDFVLSNFVNSGYRQIYVLTQYMASSLIKHLNRTWYLGGLDQFIEVVPAQMRRGDHWYRGTADAVFQNINLVRDARAQHVAVFGGDHIYKFDIAAMEAAHRANDADLTVAAFPVPREQAHQFGVIQIDAEGRIIGFQEKPDDPAPMPGRPDHCLVSMGNYFFKAPLLLDELRADGVSSDSSHDFGRDIIPRLVAKGARVYTYDFSANTVRGDPPGAEPYWRDVGTLDSYFMANMELRSPLPNLNLYNRRWRIRTSQRDYPPARFVRSGSAGTPADVVDSLVCEGSIVESAVLREVLMGYDGFIHADSVVEWSVLLSGCSIGHGAKVRGVLMDKNSSIAPGAVIGHDRAADAARFPFITSDGIVVLPKGTHVPAEGPLQFAYDMAELLENDPATKDAMAVLKGHYAVSDYSRHSYRSAGPRYRKDSPGGAFFGHHGEDPHTVTAHMGKGPS